MTSSGDYLLKKRLLMSSSSTNLNNNSVERLSKSLSRNGKDRVTTINPNILNSKMKYLYSTKKITPGIYNNANNFPILIYNDRSATNTGFAPDFDELLNDYSISKINYFVQFLKADQYDRVFSELTTDETQKILYGLYNLRQNTSVSFKHIIDIYEGTFMSVKYFYFLYWEIKNNQSLFLEYEKDSEILNNMELLKNYIKKQEKKMSVFTDCNITVQKLNIKPEYATYINTYGLPTKLGFDPVKLQKIIDTTNPV